MRCLVPHCNRRAERSSATETGTAGARLAECEGALGEEGPWDQARRRGSAKESDDACDETPRNGLRGSEGGEGRGGGEGEGDGGGESGDSGSEVHHADSGSGQSGGRDGGGDSDGLNEGSDRVDPPRDGSESPCATPMGHGKPLPSRGVSSALVASSGSAPAPLLAAAVKVADVGAVVRPVTGGSRVRLTPEADKTDNGYGNDDEHVGGVRRDDSAGGRDVGASGHDGVRGGRGRVVAVEKRVAATGAVTGRASGIDNAGAGAETRVGRGGGGAGYLGKETTWLERGGPMGKDLPGERIESREGRWPRVVSVQPERESPAGLVERLVRRTPCCVVTEPHVPHLDRNWTPFWFCCLMLSAGGVVYPAGAPRCDGRGMRLAADPSRWSGQGKSHRGRRCGS